MKKQLTKLITFTLLTLSVLAINACTIIRHDDVRNPSFQTKTLSIVPSWSVPDYSKKEGE